MRTRFDTGARSTPSRVAAGGEKSGTGSAWAKPGQLLIPKAGIGCSPRFAAARAPGPFSKWVDFRDSENSVISFLRRAEDLAARSKPGVRMLHAQPGDHSQRHPGHDNSRAQIGRAH